MQANTPIIIRRSSHNISRSFISPNALRIMYRLRDNGFKACLVGGSVRDILIGKKPKDFDIVTDATPGEIKKLFRNCRLIGRRFRLAHIHFRDEIIEVATFRAGGDLSEPEEETGNGNGEEEPADETRREPGHFHKSDDGVLLRDNLFGTPEEDAWRRDFTVNALSYSIADFSIIDYVGGMEDLEQKIIRTIGDPATRIGEDPVRMLRAIRISAQLDFRIEHHLWEAITEHARRITLASPARLFDEFLKLMLSGAAERCWQFLCQSGLAAAIFPDFSQWLSGKGPEHLRPALDRIDNAVHSGNPPGTTLLLALFFGDYLTDKGEGLLYRDNSWQSRVDGSLALFMEETAGRLLIPQRTIAGLREILLLQQRLLKIPGRKPENVIARPGFANALHYLRFTSADNPQLEKAAAWWERHAGADGIATVDEAQPETKEKHHRGRRRRRRRKKVHAPPQQND